MLADAPDALLYPTINGIGPVEERYSHITPLAETIGLRIGVIDPGSVNLGAGVRVRQLGVRHRATSGSCATRHGLVPGMSIFEPGFLRAALSVLARRQASTGHDAPLLLRRSGDARRTGGFWFGLPPTEASLDAYLQMLGDCPLPWSVAVSAATSSPTDLPALALERGGHLRVGLEDHRGRTVDQRGARRRSGEARSSSPAGWSPTPVETAELLGLYAGLGRRWLGRDTVGSRRTPRGRTRHERRRPDPGEHRRPRRRAARHVRPPRAGEVPRPRARTS